MRSSPPETVENEKSLEKLVPLHRRHLCHLAPRRPRGWRERHHHEHVDGDYKHPPPPSNFNDARHRHSKRLVRGESYVIAPEGRSTIGSLLLQSFHHRQVPILALAVCETNFHALIQVPDGRVKRILGLAKRHVTFSFSPIIDASNHRSRLWEREGGVKPINDRPHANNTFQYILDHSDEGAWVWSFRDPVPLPANPAPPSLTAGFTPDDPL